jgi:hypothetical protein
MRNFGLAVFLSALACASAWAQNSQVKLPGDRQKTEAEILRLPQAVADAKSIFIANGGGHDAAFVAFYNDVKQWGKYSIVDSPNQADLVFQFNFAMVQTGENVWTSRNMTTMETLSAPLRLSCSRG